ncbi:hypothetical protein ACLB2K_073494 [Fragaria x ananassa]
MTPFLLLLSCFLLCAATATSNIPKHHVVYMGSSLSDGNRREAESAESAYLEMLSSIIPSHQRERTSIIHKYNHAFRGFSAMLTESEASALSGHADVVSIFPDSILELHTTRSWDFIQEAGAEPGGVSYHPRPTTTSDDVIIGVIDTVSFGLRQIIKLKRQLLHNLEWWSRLETATANGINVQRVLSEEVVGNPEDNLDSDDAWGGIATPDSSDDDEDGGSGKGGGNTGTGFVYGQSSTVGGLNNFSSEENYDHASHDHGYRSISYTLALINASLVHRTHYEFNSFSTVLTQSTPLRLFNPSTPLRLFNPSTPLRFFNPSTPLPHSSLHQDLSTHPRAPLCWFSTSSLCWFSTSPSLLHSIAAVASLHRHHYIALYSSISGEKKP